MPTESAVQTHREAAGLSRAELAKRSGLALSTIYKLEREGATPTRATSLVLAVALGCRPADLRGDA